MAAKQRAAVAYLEREDGRILCVWNKRYGGWGMPGGLVEPHETITEGLVRELREETGLEIAGQPEKIWDGPPLTLQKETGRGSHVYVFRIWTNGHSQPREMEVGAPVTWFKREEFLKWSPFAEFYRPMFARMGRSMNEEHLAGCPLGLATGRVAVECKHGYDVCPECDPCLCESLENDLLARPITEEA